MSRLPGGRGYRSGPDRTVNQQEIEYLRRKVQEIQTNQMGDGSRVPLRAVFYLDLSAAQIAANFDPTGLGHVTGDYPGLALCNGNNGTRALANKFVRCTTGASGAMGGADAVPHTHAIDHDHGVFASGSESAHTHAVDHDHGSFSSGSEAAHTHAVDHDHGSFTSGSESSHTHGVGSLVANVIHDTAANRIYTKAISASFTSDRYAAVSSSTVASNAMGAATAISGTSGAGSTHSHTVDPPAFSGASGAGSSHSHAVDPPAFAGPSGAGSSHSHTVDVPAWASASGAASNTENRPAFVELVPVMRVS